MIASSKLATLALALILVGAGCASKPATQDAQEPSAAPTETSSGDTMDGGSAQEANVRAIDTAVETDDTWRTYVNQALGFEFMWPTAGRYAPLWEVQFVTNERLVDGCFASDLMEHRKVSVRDVVFCHSTDEASDGVLTDYYVTTIENTNAMIVFTKSAAGMGPDFSREEYRAHLNEIVSTFRSTK